MCEGTRCSTGLVPRYIHRDQSYHTHTTHTHTHTLHTHTHTTHTQSHSNNKSSVANCLWQFEDLSEVLGVTWFHWPVVDGVPRQPQ